VIIVCLWLAGAGLRSSQTSPAGPKAAVAMFVVGVLPSVLNVVAVRNRTVAGGCIGLHWVATDADPGCQADEP